jgi:hypothetical protein
MPPEDAMTLLVADLWDLGHALAYLVMPVLMLCPFVLLWLIVRALWRIGSKKPYFHAA